MIEISYAQNYEDVMLGRALAAIEHGFYIDVGAQDPVNDSVTKAFYEKGWRGINIEPVPRWHDRLVTDRPEDINLRLAVSDHTGKLHLTEVLDSGLSTSREEFVRKHVAEGRAVHEFVVDCMPLDAICEMHGVDQIHFLKVDCEGAEAQALRSIDLRRYRPWIIVVESTVPNTQEPNFEEWEHLLTDRGYLFVYADGLNRFYIAEEHGELAESFSFPPNVFDRFVPAAQETLRCDMLHMEAEHAAEVMQRDQEFQMQLNDYRVQLNDYQVQLRALRSDFASLERDRSQLRIAYDTLSQEYATCANSFPVRADRYVRRVLLLIVRRVLGPVARPMRPVLRWLRNRKWLKSAVLAVLGRDSTMAHHASLFLRNDGTSATPQASLPRRDERNDATAVGVKEKTQVRMSADVMRIFKGLERVRAGQCESGREPGKGQ